jgi:hypothetical protein
MAKPFSLTLTPERPLIFRITHRANLPWILENGLHCQSAAEPDPKFVSIGNPELIDRRRSRMVPIPPGGTLNDYVPFYFTPYSPMLYNIRTGYAGIPQRKNEEIAVLVSSLPALKGNGVAYVFSDRHAYLQTASFFSDDKDLETAVDFPLLQSRDFNRDPDHPEKFDRYQAEALAHRHVPVSALLGIGCYTSGIKDELEATCSDLAVDVKIVHRAEWYFS